MTSHSTGAQDTEQAVVAEWAHLLEVLTKARVEFVHGTSPQVLLVDLLRPHLAALEGLASSRVDEWAHPLDLGEVLSDVLLRERLRDLSAAMADAVAGLSTMYVHLSRLSLTEDSVQVSIERSLRDLAAVADRVGSAVQDPRSGAPDAILDDLKASCSKLYQEMQTESHRRIVETVFATTYEPSS